MKHIKLFEAFTASQELNEAFKSSILRRLMGVNSDLPAAIANGAKLAIDQIEDGDLITTTPELARKAKGGNKITLYISDVKKKNPHADQYDMDLWLRLQKIMKVKDPDPKDAPGYFIDGADNILAVLDGDNEFLYITRDPRPDNEYNDGKWRDDYRLTDAKGKNFDDERAYGIGKGSGKGAKQYGLTSLKRVADVSDRAVVIDINALEKRYSTKGKIALRADQKDGALKYKDPWDIIEANKTRYRDILADAATKLPYAKMAKDAVDLINSQIKDGLKEFGEELPEDSMVIGNDKKGNQITTYDAARLSHDCLVMLKSYSMGVESEEWSMKEYGDVSANSKLDALKHSRWFKKAIKKIEGFDYSGYATHPYFD